MYYEDLEEYLKFKNKETEKFVEPPVAQQISVQEKEDEIFRRRLEEARKSIDYEAPEPFNIRKNFNTLLSHSPVRKLK